MPLGEIIAEAGYRVIVPDLRSAGKELKNALQISLLFFKDDILWTNIR